MDFNFDSAALQQTLEDEGYDVVVGDVVSGRKETASGVSTVDVDRGGRVKFARTVQEDEPAFETATVDGRSYSILVERTSTTTITVELQSPEELKQALAEMERMGRGTQST